jgi:hypothetical protein
MEVSSLCTYNEVGSEETEAVGLLAAELEVSEYEVFALSHRLWFGTEASEEVLNTVFKQYLFQERIPFWAHDAVRKAVCMLEEGSFDPRAFGIEPPEAQTAMKVKGYLFAALLVILVLLMCVVTRDA